MQINGAKIKTDPFVGLILLLYTNYKCIKVGEQAGEHVSEHDGEQAKNVVNRQKQRILLEILAYLRLKTTFFLTFTS